MSDSPTTAAAAKIVWFELPTSDTTRAREFYGQLFNWSFEPFGGMDYHMAGEAGGAVYHDPSTKGITTYFGVEDIEQATARVVELGGSAAERQEIPGMGVYVHCEDTDGNRFGMYQATVS